MPSSRDTMRKTDEPDALFPATSVTPTSSGGSPTAVSRNFDPARLTQARQLAGLTKKQVADLVGVSAAAIGQYESGTRPGPDVLTALAEQLGYPTTFFQIGRPYARLDSSAAHFRHLRETRAYQRAKAVSFTEQMWELTYALEQRVELPHIDLPGFAGGEITPGSSLPADPVQAARALRQHWKLGSGPVSHLSRTLEIRGIVVVHAPADGDFKTVDAFSTSRLPRPFVIVSRDRTTDVYRHRFTTAHELGHLVLHSDALPGDTQHEREADAFAAEFLTPRDSIVPELPTRIDLAAFAELQRTWGASMQSLIYRCREVGLFSDTTATRAYQRLNTAKSKPEPVEGFPGEQPTLLRKAFDLASDYGLSIVELADELHWPLPRLRLILGMQDHRPALDVIRGGRHDTTDGPTGPQSSARRLAVASGQDGASRD
ncbi:DNA-binding protein [Paractinoplanes tereljensis]|uniref:DNA-binding protein n=2 Tax=Paractinoplanes tereljensis TaxID=571912 RepID=A0A919TX03_9ACTN|nr:DNA-binding protein [Actinoplanes tereljensis]